MTYCNNLNENQYSHNHKLGHQFLIESSDSQVHGEDIDISNQELIQLITKNNELDTTLIDNKINGISNEAKFSDIVKVKKNFITFDENKLNS